MILPDKEYRQQLEIVAAELKDSADLIDIRGNGAGQFVYAKNDLRALEIYQGEDGIHIEFWKNPNHEPVNEMTVFSYETAAVTALK